MLRTHRLVLTTWLPGDSEDLFRLHSEPTTMLHVGPGRPETPEECDRRLDTYLSEQRSRGWTKWRVQTPDGSMIGRAGFGAHGPNRELGYTLAPACWGRGLATELAGALVNWHDANPDAHLHRELWAYAAVPNVASQQVLEKVGFEFVGHRDHHATLCAFYVRTAPLR